MNITWILKIEKIIMELKIDEIILGKDSKIIYSMKSLKHRWQL